MMLYFSVLFATVGKVGEGTIDQGCLLRVTHVRNMWPTMKNIHNIKQISRIFTVKLLPKSLHFKHGYTLLLLRHESRVMGCKVATAGLKSRLPNNWCSGLKINFNVICCNLNWIWLESVRDALLATVKGKTWIKSATSVVNLLRNYIFHTFTCILIYSIIYTSSPFKLTTN